MDVTTLRQLVSLWCHFVQPRPTASHMEPLTITVPEAARALGISRTKAYALTRSGELPSFRLGRAVRVPIAELRAWITTNAAVTTRRKK